MSFRCEMLHWKSDMSEFKYACPVCGQHMVCDSSQSGSVMECPTCFQKIVAPQAPTTDDPKFILTGTKYTEKKIPDSVIRNAAAAQLVRETKAPVAFISFVVILIVALAAGAALVVFRGKTSNSGSSTNTSANATANASADNATASTSQTPPAPKKVEKPPAVAPPASDTNWMLALDSITNVPDATVAGRIHGQDFIMERAYFQNGMLTLRNGTHGPLVFGCTINFGGAQPEALSGQSINVNTNADTAARITFHWKNDTASGKDNFDSGYALRLDFGTLDKNHLPGKIYLCTPDTEKSYLVGSFNADARKPKPKK